MIIPSLLYLTLINISKKTFTSFKQRTVKLILQTKQQKRTNLFQFVQINIKTQLQSQPKYQDKSLKMSKEIDAIMRQLNFSWFSFVGPDCICSEVVHPGLTCLQQLLLKFKMTLNTVSKFYIIFHLIPYALKVKKLIRQQRLMKGTMKAFLNFLGSLLFMIHLVCGLKAGLCFSSNAKLKIGGETFFWGGFPTAISILWQSPGRRQQIAYYAFVRSLRAAYVYLKRRNIIKFTISNEFLVAILFGSLCYFYTENHHNLKYLNIFEGLWGKM